MSWPGCRPSNCWTAIATRRFTPRDVIEDVIAALERTNASCNVVVTATYDQARAAADAATAAWSAGQTGRQIDRRAGQHQGSRLCRRRAGARRRARQQGSGADRRCRGGCGAEGGRRDRDLQDHDLRVRLQADRRQPGVRHHPQSLEHAIGPAADRAAAPRRRSPPDAVRSRSAPTASARSACRRRSAAWSASSRPSDWFRGRRDSRRRHGRRSRIPARSRARLPTRPCFWK